jgi:hypothetical protein
MSHCVPRRSLLWSIAARTLLTGQSGICRALVSTNRKRRPIPLLRDQTHRATYGFFSSRRRPSRKEPYSAVRAIMTMIELFVSESRNQSRAAVPHRSATRTKIGTRLIAKSKGFTAKASIDFNLLAGLQESRRDDPVRTEATVREVDYSRCPRFWVALPVTALAARLLDLSRVAEAGGTPFPAFLFCLSRAAFVQAGSSNRGTRRIPCPRFLSAGILWLRRTRRK